VIAKRASGLSSREAMEITEVEIIPYDKGRLKAYVNITLDRRLIISDLKIIRSEKGYLVSMPARKRADGKYLDIIYPINAETREMLEERILAEYEKITGEPVNRRKLK
jgi:stage V sporulation protein G